MPSNSAIQANGAVRTGQLAQVNAMANDDMFVITIFSANVDGQTRAISLNSVANALPITKVQPATFINSTANTTVLGGQMFFDSDNLYVSVANGSVKRVSLEAF